MYQFDGNPIQYHWLQHKLKEEFSLFKLQKGSVLEFMTMKWE